MISTRGRYALRVLIDLAEHQGDGYIPMRKVAERQGISLKYLERIMPLLLKDRLVDTLPGKGGGYRLNRAIREYNIGHILRLTEGDFAPVACLECGAAPCDRVNECKTLPMWKGYQEVSLRYFDGITLADLVK